MGWKDIKGYEGYYIISIDGRIKSLDRKIKSRDEMEILIKGSEMKSSTRSGYLRVALSKNGKSKHFTLSRLVAEHFVPNPEKKKYVNHIDGDKSNNHASNLEWCTHSENTIHAYENGLMDRRGENSRSPLTEDLVLEIRATKNIGCFSDREIAEGYDVGRKTINNIVNRKTWSHI